MSLYPTSQQEASRVSLCNSQFKEPVIQVAGKSRLLRAMPANKATDRINQVAGRCLREPITQIRDHSTNPDQNDLI